MGSEERGMLSCLQVPLSFQALSVLPCCPPALTQTQQLLKVLHKMLQGFSVIAHPVNA
jgi:hypothetical protein